MRTPHIALAILVAGCGGSCAHDPPTGSRADSPAARGGGETTAEVEPSAPAEAEPATGPAASRPPSTRVRGPVVGAFEPLAERVVVGEPLVVRFHVDNDSDEPMAFSWGSDYRNSVGPLRYRWIVRDTDGTPLCDLRASPPMTMGGLGTERTIGPGERFDRLLVLNSVCDALSMPGRYHVTGVRVLTRDVYGGDDSALGERCDPYVPPDVTQRPIDLAGQPMADECVEWLRSFPAVASDFEVEVLPYDRERVRAAVVAMLEREGDDWNEAQSRYGGWLCARLGDECAGRFDAEPPSQWLPPALEGLPEQLPATDPPGR